MTEIEVGRTLRRSSDRVWSGSKYKMELSRGPRVKENGFCRLLLAGRYVLYSWAGSLEGSILGTALG